MGPVRRLDESATARELQCVPCGHVVPWRRAQMGLARAMVRARYCVVGDLLNCIFVLLRFGSARIRIFHRRTCIRMDQEPSRRVVRGILLPGTRLSRPPTPIRGNIGGVDIVDALHSLPLARATGIPLAEHIHFWRSRLRGTRARNGSGLDRTDPRDRGQLVVSSRICARPSASRLHGRGGHSSPLPCRYRAVVDAAPSAFARLGRGAGDGRRPHELIHEEFGLFWRQLDV